MKIHLADNIPEPLDSIACSPWVKEEKEAELANDSTIVADDAEEFAIWLYQNSCAGFWDALLDKMKRLEI